MPWPASSSFREPDKIPVVEPTVIPQLSKQAIALSISAATLPLLGGLVLSRLAGAGLTQLGKASEELWRGDRLPLLRNQPKD